MEEEKKRSYKIELGDTIIVHRRDYNGFTFYSTNIKKKHADGTEMYLTKKLSFPKGTDIADGTKIKIKTMFEDGYIPKNSYDTVWVLFIIEWEVVENDNAFQDYNKSKQDFGLDDLNIDVSDEDLPF